jgi:hypothetical protein
MFLLLTTVNECIAEIELAPEDAADNDGGRLIAVHRQLASAMERVRKTPTVAGTHASGAQVAAIRAYARFTGSQVATLIA